MSSLIFHIDSSQALIATDTLAVSTDGKPLMFTTKALLLPHMNMVMVGTGLGGFLDRWVLIVNSGLIVPGIDALNSHTQRHLNAIWGGIKEQFPDLDRTTTVYHIGISEGDGDIHAYAYRSENGFIGEPLGYGMRVKPECTVAGDYSLPGDLLAMMQEQRKIQSDKPIGERVYIGGEIVVHHLQRSGCNVYVAEKFPDYEETIKAIYDRFRPDGSHK